MNFPSKLIEDAVTAFSQLPGVGKKTALRLVLHMLQEPVEISEQFADAIVDMRKKIKFCAHCHNVSDDTICSICSGSGRDKTTVCVVESIRDIMAIENTNQYKGLYHVLGGVISPIEGVSPKDLNIDTFIQRIPKEGIKEIIMALSPTIEGDTTIFYLSRQLKDQDVKITTLARGISFGGELEYADEMTLGRSIMTRRLYDNDINKSQG